MFQWLKNLMTSRAGTQTAHVSSPTLGSLFGVSSVQGGVVVNKSTALHCMAYWRGIRLLSESLAIMPIRLYQRAGRQGTPTEITDHPSLDLLNEPNPTQTIYNFVQTCQSHVLTRGNGYAEIVTDGTGKPVRLWVMDPDDTLPGWNADGSGLVYSSRRDPGRKLTQEQVLHVPGLGFDGVQGYDVVSLAAKAIGLAMGAEQYGANWFGSEGRPSGVLQNKGRLSQEAMDRQRADWERIHAPGSHRIAILQEDTTFNPYNNDPTKAQALEVRKFQVTEIARLLGIPPHMLFDLDRATFSNIEQMSLEFVTFSLSPCMVPWEQELTRKLLNRAERKSGMFFRFDTSVLLRGDPHNSASSHSLLVNAGIETPNEARAAFDLAPEAGDATKLRIPLNSAVLGATPADAGKKGVA